MKTRVLCLLADGFEEIEFVVPVDLLRRAGIEVLVLSLQREVVTGRSGIRLLVDGVLEDQAFDSFQMLLIPGGPGVNEMRRDERVMMLVREFATRGKFLAAICAAPLILHDAGLLETARFCAHVSTRSELPNALDERLVIDNKLITSRGAGTAVDFGLALLTELAGAPVAEKVAADIMV